MAEKECDNCKEKTKRKYLGKIRGKYLCRKCRKEVRKNHRKETINEAGIGEDLKSLDKKISNDSARKSYRKRNPYKERKTIEGVPVPRGSTSGKVKQKNKSESYLGFQERQILLGIIMKRGESFESAKKIIKEIKNQLKDTRENMRKKNKSEEQIKIKMQNLLEELYNS